MKSMPRMNTIAPEHASIQTVNPQPYIEKVKYAAHCLLMDIVVNALCRVIE